MKYIKLFEDFYEKLMKMRNSHTYTKISVVDYMGKYFSKKIRFNEIIPNPIDLIKRCVIENIPNAILTTDFTTMIKYRFDIEGNLNGFSIIANDEDWYYVKISKRGESAPRDIYYECDELSGLFNLLTNMEILLL